MSELKTYPVWDAPTRWFHWINVLCAVALAAVGVVILYAGDLGVSNNGKFALKRLHVLIGYVFAANLVWRLVWAFVGNRFARWREMLPGPECFRDLQAHFAAIAAGRPRQYLGHNPLGRMAVAALFLLIAIQAVTGLVLAGTDIFYPPIGRWIAQWVVAPGVDPATLVPYAPEMVDKTAWEAMRAWRKPFAVVHLYSFYVLAVLVVLHVAAVVVTEAKEGGAIVSAMFTGKKVLADRPVDEERTPGA